MTRAEEILNELQKENPHSIPTLKAMNQFAKEQSIAFAEFIGKEKWTMDTNLRGETQWCSPFYIYKSTEELFQLFLDQNKNK